MNNLGDQIRRFIPLINKFQASQSPKTFAAFTILIFVLTLSAADSIGFVPYYVDGTEPMSSRVAIADMPELGEEGIGPTPISPITAVGALPERIRSSSISLDLPVQDSDTRDIDALYEMLKEGPVRYVDSAKLGEEGNVLIFGHSSQLPVVTNQMYKAFNNVPDLEAGDSIIIEGGGKEYVYSVVSIKSVDISDPTAVVDLSKEGNRLTLVTCDTLTGKTARFVLEAELIGSYDTI